MWSLHHVCCPIMSLCIDESDGWFVYSVSAITAVYQLIVHVLVGCSAYKILHQISEITYTCELEIVNLIIGIWTLIQEIEYLSNVSSF